MRIILAAALAVIAAAAPASARQPRAADAVSLAAGEEATIAFDDGGRTSVTARGRAAPLSAFDQAALHNLTTGSVEDALGPNSRPLSERELRQSPPPIAAGVVRIAFVPVSGGKETFLILENGHTRALAYRARIFQRGRGAPTDVCVVLPGLRAYEHWPYSIERIELTRFRLEAWEGGAPRCE
ncbi:MAG TPA: hypothetical protein VGB79_13440 [Allosphingosinicella sp.]|jgi:hypothetical protein